MLVNHHGEVTLNRWEPGQWLRSRYARARQHWLDVHLEGDQAAFDFEVRADDGMQLADVAELAALEDHCCTPAWVKQLCAGTLIGTGRGRQRLDARRKD